jgi:alpha-beta hydrolase superfamily lysophospholipase
MEFTNIFFLHTRQWLLVFCFSWVVSGCNHLFYQPDSIEYLRTEDLKYRSKRLSINYENISLGAWRIFTNEKPRALVLQAHGNAQNLTAHVGMLGYFAANGFDLLGFDYQGYGVSSGEPTREGTIADTKAAIIYAASQSPRLPLIVLGQSLGGAVAVAAMQDLEVQKLVSLLVLDSTFAGYRSIARRKLNDIWLTWLFQYPLSLLISSAKSPVDFAPVISTPILQVHAKEDPVVPIVEGRELYDAFSASRDKRWVEFEGESHIEGFAKPIPEVEKAFQTFLSDLSL